MEIVTSLFLQGFLLALALVVTILRCWVRLGVERRSLMLPDYLVWGGILCAFGWFTCSTKALYILIDRQLDEETKSDSVVYLKVVFVSFFLFDTGLYFPKASLVAFYWWLVPQGFRRLQIAVYVTTAIVACTFVASVLVDILIVPKLTDNRSAETQMTCKTCSDLIIHWTLNFGTDLLLFGLPFFIFGCLKLRRRQKIGLVGVFSLGAITMAISLARFIVYNMDYDVTNAAGSLWYTAEMCTAIIVVSLPYLKVLIVKPTPNNTYDRSNPVQLRSGSVETIGSRSNGYSSNIQDNTLDDDEMEFSFLDR